MRGTAAQHHLRAEAEEILRNIRRHTTVLHLGVEGCRRCVRNIRGYDQAHRHTARRRRLRQRFLRYSRCIQAHTTVCRLATAGQGCTAGCGIRDSVGGRDRFGQSCVRQGEQVQPPPIDQGRAAYLVDAHAIADHVNNIADRG